jgi:hypothetical protein
MRKNNLFISTFIAVFVLSAFGFSQSGNAGTQSRYNIHMQYDVSKTVIPDNVKAEGKAQGVIISIAEFTDIRQVDDKKIIGYVRERDDTRVPIFTKNDAATMVVANGIKEYLKKAGYGVADKTIQWNLKEETLPKGSGKVIIGGTIESMEVTCWRGVFSHDYKANMKLNLVIADAAKGEILYQGSVTFAYSRTDVSFSEGELGRVASIALGEAIEKIFEGKTIMEKIKEAVNLRISDYRIDFRISLHRMPCSIACLLRMDS